MKIMKRFLAMVLTLAMVATLFAGLTFTASAATSVTIASWGKVSLAANTAVSASAYQGTTAPTMSSNKAMTTSGTNCYYGSSAGGATITISGLPTAYSVTRVTFYTRASQQGTMTVSYSTNNGTTYTNAGSASITKSEALKTVTFSPAVSGVTNIKFTHSAGSGSLYFGTVTVTGEANTSYSLTAQSNNTAYGTVGTPANGIVSCTPADGYYVESATVTADSGLSVAVSGNDVTYSGTQTADATITVNFAARQQYALTYSVNGDTSVIASTQQYGGDTVTLPTAAAIASYTFVGWLPSTYAPNDTEPTGLLAAGSTYTMPAAATTLYAVYAIAGQGGGTFTLAITSGGTTYYVGTQSGTYLSAVTNANDAAQFGLETASGGSYVYYMNGTDKMYIGGAGTSTSMSAAGTTASYVWTVSESGSTMTLYIGSRFLGLNTSASPARFSTYSSTYAHEFTVQRSASYTGYTTTVNTVATYYTLEYSCSPAAGGTITCDVNSGLQVEEDELVTLTAVPADHYSFDSWTVTGIDASDYEADGDELIVTMTADVTVVANFTADPTYTVTVTQVTGGTMAAAPKTSGIFAGETITLTATPAAHYSFGGWTVTGATVADASAATTSFTMPAGNVTVTGTFIEAAQYTVTYYDTDSHVLATETYYDGDSIAAADIPSVTAPDGFSLKGWYTTTYSASSAPTYATPAGTTVTEDLVFYAVYAELGSGGSLTFKLLLNGKYVGARSGSNTYLSAVSSADDAAEFGYDIVDDKAYLYYMDGSDKVYIYNTSSDTSLSFSTNSIPSGSTGYEYWTVEEDNGTISFKNGTGTRYLALNSDRFSTYTPSANQYPADFTQVGGGASIEGYTTNPVATKITVTWMNGSDTYLTERVEYNTQITAPATDPEKTEAEQEYYTFAGWSETEGGAVISSFPTASAELGDKTYYAVYTTTAKLTVTWANYDSTTLATEYYRAGETPVYSGSEPTKPADSSFYYTFAGWDPTVSVVSAAITYTAVFTAHDRFELTATLSKNPIKVGRYGQVNYTLTDMGTATDEFTPSFSSASSAIATVDATGRITAVSAGTTDITVTFADALDSNGDPLTETISLTVIEDTSAGGYTLMTQENEPTDWSGDYIIMGRLAGALSYLNSYQIMTPKWIDDSTACVEDGNTLSGFGSTIAPNNASLVTLTTDGDNAEGTIDSAYSSGDTISMEATGDNDFGDYTVYDRITEIDDSYAFTFELVDDINGYYTIRIKGTNYYLANTNTTLSGNNGMQYVSTADASDTTMLWKLRWATAADGLTATDGYTPDVLMIESVYGLENSVSRCILFNNMGNPNTASNITNSRFRVYGSDAYHNSSYTLAGSSNGISYSIYLFGNPNTFKAQIYYQGNQITISEAGEVSSTNATATVTSALYPDIADYPTWSQVGDPVWSIVENSANNYMTIAQDGIITLNNSAANSYALVQVTYTVHDEINNVNHEVSTIAKVLVTAPTYTYATVIYEDYDGNETEGQYTVNNQVSELPLAAYVVNDDNGNTSKTDDVVMGGTLVWSAAVNSGDGTATIGADGILHLSSFTEDGIVTVTVSGATGDGVSATAGTYKVYVKAITYTTTIINATDATTGTYNSSTDTITYTGSESSGKLGYNVLNGDGDGPSASTFTLSGGTWTISGAAEGALINSSGVLDFSNMDRTVDHTITVLLSRVTATAGGVITTNLSDTITIVVLHQEIQQTLAAVDDTVIIDWALPVTFSVLTNDNVNVEYTVSNGTLPTGVVSNGNGSFTYTPSGWQTEDQTFTYTLSGTVNGSAATSTATVTLKTADSVYYEDTYSDIFTFTGTWTDVTEGSEVASQISTLNTAADFEYEANYASYASYSGGTAKTTTVSKGVKPSVSFTFAGTGFDVISATTNNTGAIMLTVKNSDNQTVTDPATGRPLNQIIDTFRGYSYVAEPYTRYGLKEVTRLNENGVADSTGNYYYDTETASLVENTVWYSGDTANYYDDTNAFTEDSEGSCIIFEVTSNWIPFDVSGDAAANYNSSYYQIPILKVTGLPYGTYTVTVKPTYSAAYDRVGDGSYDFIFDGVRIHNPVSGRTAEYKYISIHDAVANGGFGSGTVVTCDHVGYDRSDWTFYSRARNTNSDTTCNRGAYVRYCAYCGGVADTAYFHVAVTADDTELGVGGYNSLPATTQLRYTLTADASDTAGVQAAIQAKLDALAGTYTEYWASNAAAVFTCTNNSSLAVAAGAGTTYATLQLKDPNTQAIMASAIHSPMITVYENESHTHTFGDWAHDADSDPSTHTHTCTGEDCSFSETEECVFTSAVTTEPTANEAGVRTYTCAECGYSYTETIPALGGTYTATFIVPTGATAPAEQEGSSATMPAAVAAPAAFDAHTYTFVGWAASTVSDTTTAPTIYEVGDEVALTADTDFYALYTYGAGGTAYTLATSAPNYGDSIILATLNDGTYYALPNSFTSGGTVAGTAITVSDNTVSASAATEDLAYTLYLYGTHTELQSEGGNGFLKLNSSKLAVTNQGDTGYLTIGTANAASGLFTITSENNAGRYLATSGSNFTFSASAASEVYFFVKAAGTATYTTELAAACHHENSTSVVTAPTCTADGFTTYTCSDCGESWTGDTVAALGHNYVCTSNNDGTHTMTCSRCSDAYTEDCSFDEGVISGTTVTYTCAQCSYSYTASTEYAVSYVVQSGVTYTGNSRSGNAITLPTAVSIPATYNAQTYTLVGWATQTAADSTTEPTCYEPGEVVTITDDTAFYPVYSYGGGGGNGTWTLLDDAADLTAGMTVVFASNANGVTAGDISSSIMGFVSSTFATGNATITSLGSGTVQMTVGGSSGAWTFANSDGDLLGATAAKKVAWDSGTTTWSVSIGSNGAATIQNGTSSYGRFLYNSGSPRFTTYTSATSSTMVLPQIYYLAGGGTTTYTFTLAESVVTDNYTVTVSPATLTMPFNGEDALTVTLTNNGVTVTPESIDYTSGNTNLVVVDASGNLLAGDTAGTTTITVDVLAPDSEIYSATVTVTVVDPDVDITVNYVGSATGNVYNWGTRGTVATFLTANADAYYTGSYSYSTLSALAGSSTATAAAIYNSALGTAIHNMLVDKQDSTTSYDGTKTLYKYTDCVGSDTSHLSTYYSAAQVTSTWDGGSTWNREHTWPNSKGLNGNDENDIMMLRPSAVSENSSRGNTAYGESSGYYNPNKFGQSMHGDVARNMLQHLLRWGNTSYFYGSSGVIESRAILLQWLEEDPVDTWEMGRNDAVERITGVRNVFVDYPELAFILLGESVPANYTTPSASGAVAAATYNNTYGSGYEAVTYGTRSAVLNKTAAADESIAAAPVDGAKRSINPGSFNGAVIIDGKGATNLADDFAAYGPKYGVYLAPGQGIVFSLTSEDTTVTTQALQIGAKAVNGTAAQMDVASISNGQVSTGIKYLLQNQTIASATEMYYELDGSQVGWNNGESSVIVIYNSGSGVLAITNLRYPSDNTLTMNINDVQTQRAAKMIQIVYGEPETDPDPIVIDSELDLNFKSASLSLNSDISMNFYVDEEVFDSADGLYAVFTKALYNADGEITGYDTVTTSNAVYTDYGYDFRFDGINPAEMGSAVTATLYGYRNGELISGDTVNYSVLTYVRNMFPKIEDTAFRTLLADLVAYGAAAQTYVGYNTANLATAAAPAELMAYATAAVPTLCNCTAFDTKADASVSFTAAYLSLREKVTVCYTVDASDYDGSVEDLSLRITYTDTDGAQKTAVISGSDFVSVNGKYVASFSGLNALQMRTVLKAEIFAGETCVSSALYYSIEAYAQSKTGGNDSLASLVNAMMKFGDSAAAYFAD